MRLIFEDSNPDEVICNSCRWHRRLIVYRWPGLKTKEIPEIQHECSYPVPYWTLPEEDNPAITRKQWCNTYDLIVSRESCFECGAQNVPITIAEHPTGKWLILVCSKCGARHIGKEQR